MADESNGLDTQAVTLRIFIDCSTTAQVGAIMSTCEAIGLTPKLVPMLGVRTHAQKRRSQYSMIALGDETPVGKYAKYLVKAKELLKDGPQVRIDLVRRFARVTRLEPKLAGYVIKSWVSSGVLKDG